MFGSSIGNAVLVGLCVASLAAASPQKVSLQLQRDLPHAEQEEPRPSLARRQGILTNGSDPVLDTVNCTDLNTGIDQKCWEELSLSNYVQEWVETHECRPSEGFASCFLRTQGYAGGDCTSIGGSACPPPSSTSQYTPEQYYVVYTIYSIHDFFSTWSQSLGDIAPSLSTTASKILGIFDLKRSKDNLSAVTDSASQNILSVRRTLSSTLSSVSSNHTEFLAFAEQGNFTSMRSSNYSLETQNYLQFAFNTYLTSASLQRAGIYGTMGRSTNPSQLVANGTKLAYPIQCSNSSDDSICDAWWYSSNYDAAFGLVNRENPQKNYGPALANLFANITTGELLFEAAYACFLPSTDRDPAANKLNITVNANGVNTACSSILEIQIWDMSCHADPKSNGGPQCEFLERPKDDKFWQEVDGKYQVPYAYLGPALSTPGYSLSRT